jgi:hypothetical protein
MSRCGADGAGGVGGAGGDAGDVGGGCDGGRERHE